MFVYFYFLCDFTFVLHGFLIVSYFFSSIISSGSGIRKSFLSCGAGDNFEWVDMRSECLRNSRSVVSCGEGRESRPPDLYSCLVIPSRRAPSRPHRRRSLPLHHLSHVAFPRSSLRALLLFLNHLSSHVFLSTVLSDPRIVFLQESSSPPPQFKVIFTSPSHFKVIFASSSLVL